MHAAGHRCEMSSEAFAELQLEDAWDPFDLPTNDPGSMHNHFGRSPADGDSYGRLQCRCKRCQQRGGLLL
jgi:hypothetical protein